MITGALPGLSIPRAIGLSCGNRPANRVIGRSGDRRHRGEDMTSVSTISKRLSVEIHGPLARIIFTHPPLNVFDFPMMDELLAALQQLQQDREISTVILTGGERGFSAGVDVSMHTADQIQTMFQKFHVLILALTRFPKLSPAALAHGKKAVYAWDSIHLDKGLARAEKIYIEELIQTEDAKEGIQAWLEKRKPEWKGR